MTNYTVYEVFINIVDKHEKSEIFTNFSSKFKEKRDF